MVTGPLFTAVDEQQTLLIYDGDCGFCRRCVTWLVFRWGVPRAREAHRSEIVPELEQIPGLEVASWQALDLSEYLLTPELANERVWAICRTPGRPGITRASGAAAVALLLTGCESRLWRVVGRILQLPGIRALAEVGYNLVARVRHRLPGGSASCRL